MFGALNQYPFGKVPEWADNSIPDPFATLLADPDIQLKYLIELYPYDEEAEVVHTWVPGPLGTLPFGEIYGVTKGQIETVYLSNLAFITEPEDSPPNQYFAPRVNNPLQFDLSILRGNDFGVSSPSFGALRIANNDGEFDYLTKYNWKGRRIVVKAGGEHFRYSDYATVFNGVCSGIEHYDDEVIIVLRDRGLRIEQDIVTDTYAGTSGLEGGDDLAGKIKPLLYGEAYNIEPVLVDAANLIYQIHAGSMQGVLGVFDRGVALTFQTDVADITTATPGAGQYATCLAKGYIKLGSTPAGRITADARGDNAGGYSSTVTDIALKLLTTKLGNSSFDLADIDQGTFLRLEDVLPGAAGLFVLDRASLKSLLDQLINPCGAYWYFNRTGLISAGYLEAPAVASLSIGADNIDQSGIESPVPIPGAWRISVGYAPSWVVQKEDELAGGATEDRRSFVGQEYRTVVYENRAARTRDAHAVELYFPTNLASKEDAEALLVRLVRVRGVERKIYRVPTYGTLFRVYIGDTVHLAYPRYSINKNLVVAGVGEDAQSNKTDLELWG